MELDDMRFRFARVLAPALVLAPLLAGGAHAADITSLAIMTPEQADDFGWNQQGASAAAAVASFNRSSIAWRAFLAPSSTFLASVPIAFADSSVSGSAVSVAERVSG